MRNEKDLLKPSQPFWVLGTKGFKQEVYLKQGISHFYSFSLENDTELTVVPDGCIDIVFEYGKNEMNAYACGTVLKCEKQHWNGAREIFGIRFMPGNCPAGMNISMKELIEKRILLFDVLNDAELILRMRDEHDFYQRIRVFLEVYTKYEKHQEKPYGKKELCMAVKNIMYEAKGIVRVDSLSEMTGYTERYIHKAFIDIMGFSPKTFCKIIQFQNAIDSLNYENTDNMTKLAMDLGYYDQPKFIRDFKVYAGITPCRYLKMIDKLEYRSRIEGATCE